MRKYTIFLIASCLLINYGCSHTHMRNVNYSHPFGSESDNNAYRNDTSECSTHSIDKVCTTYHETTRTSCNKNALTGGVDCLSNRTPEYTQCFDKVNSNRLNQCLYQKGWRRADENGNLL